MTFYLALKFTGALGQFHALLRECSLQPVLVDSAVVNTGGIFLEASFNHIEQLTILSINMSQ